MKLIVSTVAMLMVSTGVANASEPVKVNLYAESDGFCALRADKDIFQDADSDLLEHPFRFYLNTLDQRIVG